MSPFCVDSGTEQSREEEFLKNALQTLSDEAFLRSLQELRGRGRNDYPIELLWKALLASVAGQVSSIEEMRRKMADWPELFSKIPSSFAFSRFFSFLGGRSQECETLLFRKLEELPPEFGQVIAIASLGPIHFLFEPQFGLPLLFQSGPKNEAGEQLLVRFQASRRSKYLLGSHAYEELSKIAWDRYHLRAIIPLDTESKTLKEYRGIHYDEMGRIFCSMEKPPRAMVYAGFEEKRKALKYRCMVRHYGSSCEKFASCPLRSGVRIPIAADPRVFTPLPRMSYRWNQLYLMYGSLNRVQEKLRPFLKLAHNESRQILCCRIAALLLISAFQSRMTKV
jgi:hypothetical protein